MSDTPRTDKYMLAGVQRSRHDVIEYAKKLERLLAARDAEVAQLRDALWICLDVFKGYEKIHRAKATPDGDVKAMANARLAETCRAALAQPKEPL